jgi:BASS family bile acid:Na+ symporter
LAKGDVALSVSLTAVISLLSVITVPIILSFAMTTFMGDAAPAIDITKTAVTMFLLTVVPITLGLTLRAIFTNAMTRAEPILAKIAVALFASIIVAAVAGNWDLFVKNLPIMGPALVVLLTVLSTVGYVVPRQMGRTRNEAKTISIETGIQNGTLGIAIAAIIVNSGEGFSPYAIPSAVYGVVMYLTILPTLFIYRKMD